MPNLVALGQTMYT